MPWLGMQGYVMAAGKTFEVLTGLYFRSTPTTTLRLGEVSGSFGFGGSGFISTNKNFTRYGFPFGAGDIISTVIDLDSNPQTIAFAINGKMLEMAFRIPRALAVSVFKIPFCLQPIQ